MRAAARGARRCHTKGFARRPQEFLGWGGFLGWRGEGVGVERELEWEWACWGEVR